MSDASAQYPAFIGIGAARAGTTWISTSLSRHPGVWIPRIKELHYFTRSAKYFGPSQLQDGTLLQRLFSRQKGFWKYRSRVARALASNLARPSLAKLRWDGKYLLGRPGDQWYARLFAQGAGKVTGEITPRYGVLDRDDISALKALMSDVKIIYVMRDPVDRAWSLIKYHEKKQGRPISDLPADALIERAFHQGVVEQSDYEGILERWRSVFPREQMLELFYDEIVESPDAVLARLLSFLGLDPAHLESATCSNARVNPSFDKDIPAEFAKALAAHYLPMLCRLSDREGSYFTRWFERNGGQPQWHSIKPAPVAVGGPGTSRWERPPGREWERASTDRVLAAQQWQREDNAPVADRFAARGRSYTAPTDRF
jgi:hypothetical protein